jgi:long-chain acyl-CoA synthetase
MANMVRTTPQTIPGFFAETVSRCGDERALGFIRGGELDWRTWREVSEAATRLATAIQAAGVQPGDRVAQVSENRYEWIVTDLALHIAGAVHVPIHVTLSGQQIAEQIADCGARMVFVSSEVMLATFGELLDRNVPVWLHESQSPTASQAAAAFVATTPAEADDLATILYTSGTTGRPRGVMLSQRNLASNASSTAETFGIEPDQTRLCILPLSHIYARTCDLYTWLYVGSRLVLGESRETLQRDLQLAQPTMLSAVPYIYQRIADRIRSENADDESQRLREFFGGRIERMSSGGAPLAPDVEAWYAERGLPILAGYGLTESSPVAAFSTPTAGRFGSVGRPLPGVDVRIAADGEVLIRGPNVMLGYWHDASATAEAIRDGWLYTGDLGEIDGDGFLFIRGRKKELIVLSTAKKASPTRVESLLTASPLIEQAAVFGDGKPALVALIVPSTGHGRSVAGDLAAADITYNQYAEEIARCLASAAHEEQVRQFRLLDRAFSIERGELTAKLSLCRTVIARNFAAELSEMECSRAGPAMPDVSPIASGRKA